MRIEITIRYQLLVTEGVRPLELEWPETTQVYTRVSILKLQEVHTETHPTRNQRSDSGKAEPT